MATIKRLIIVVGFVLNEKPTTTQRILSHNGKLRNLNTLRGIGTNSPFPTIAMLFEKKFSSAGYAAAETLEDILFLEPTPRGPFNRAIEQIRHQQVPPDLLLPVRPGAKLSATFKCRLLLFRAML